jgi:hypothetical protein
MQCRFRCLGAMLLIVLASPSHAQFTSSRRVRHMPIKAKGAVTAYGNKGFGDKIDLASDSLQIVQTDIDAVHRQRSSSKGWTCSVERPYLIHRDWADTWP